MGTKIVVKLQVEGFHRWDGCNIPSEMYLKDNHRHVFYITAKKTVTHQDRDIEIISFKNQIISYLKSQYGARCEFGSKSCEMIADELARQFELAYCQVLEDGENGAEVGL